MGDFLFETIRYVLALLEVARLQIAYFVGKLMMVIASKGHLLQSVSQWHAGRANECTF